MGDCCAKPLTPALASCCAVDPVPPPQDCTLLSQEMMSSVLQKYSRQMQAEKGDSKAFTIKFLNIMDPLLPSNNLGRSVAKSSFSRIRRAFKYGASMMERICQKVRRTRDSQPYSCTA